MQVVYAVAAPRGREVVVLGCEAMKQASVVDDRLAMLAGDGFGRQRYVRRIAGRRRIDSDLACEACPPGTWGGRAALGTVNSGDLRRLRGA